MPRPPLPPDIDEFLRRPRPAVVASVRADGSPHTVATWYAWDGERVLLSMDESRLRLRFMRRNPRVALTVLDGDGWYRHVSLSGRIVSIDEDEGLRDIDRLALHYTGARSKRATVAASAPRLRSRGGTLGRERGHGNPAKHALRVS